MRNQKARMWLKACPKCHGDLFTCWGSEGDYLECLQCGKILYGVDKQIARLTGLRRLDALRTSWSAVPDVYCAA